MQSAGDAYLAFFATLRPETLDALNQLTTDDVRFRDPFNDTVGRAALRRVLAKMFEDVAEPRFHILRRAGDGEVCFVLWRFEGRLRRGGRPIAFEGVSELHVDADGRVSRHIDHWDAAGQFYERLPVLGAMLRWVRRRVAG